MAEPNFSENPEKSTPLPLRAERLGTSKGELRRWADEQTGLTVHQYAMLHRLIFHCDQHCTAWPKLRTLAEHLGIGLSTARQAIRELEQKGLLRRIPRHRHTGDGAQTSNFIRLTLPPRHVVAGGPP